MTSPQEKSIAQSPPTNSVNSNTELSVDDPLSCRMYEKKYPDVKDVVMVKVKQIADMGAYVSLLEYNNIEGMILLSEISRKRIRSINRVIRIGRNEVVVVLRVDKDKGYIDLSKRQVSPEDIKKCEEKFNKSKTVHSIMKHLAEVHHKRLEDLYIQFGWPLYRKFGHAFDAFKLALHDPDKVFEGLSIDPQIKKTLLDDIQRRLTPKAVKVRADIEVTCFSYDGIDSIKAALKAGQAAGTEEEPIIIKLVAPPLYVMTVTSMDKDKAIQMLDKSLQLIREKITSLGGELVVKVAPRSVTERDDKELTDMMEEMERQNREVPGDDDNSSEDEAPDDENQD